MKKCLMNCFIESFALERHTGCEKSYEVFFRSLGSDCLKRGGDVLIGWKSTGQTSHFRFNFSILDALIPSAPNTLFED